AVVQELEEAEEPLVELSPEPVIKVHRPRQPVQRVAIVQQEPSIDWLWYERSPESDRWGWVESEGESEDWLPPEDLWWQRSSTQSAAG
ncbi:MAG TPA: hypothetical protein DCF63_20185, partial [Planctomycetaceae bacterium]|nr:hypothetical protein [Planctomycetaceae bacterium]